MSYANYVKAIGETEYNTNGLRFATKEEAEGYGEELSAAWMLVDKYEARETNDPVNYTFTKENGATPIEKLNLTVVN